MKVIVTEKESVAKKIAPLVGADKREKGYISGGDYFITWCLGHLVENAPPNAYTSGEGKWSIEDLPIIPQVWKSDVIETKAYQFKIVKKLMLQEDVNEIICAGDCGREGELIFRLVYNQTGCTKPVKRLWVSSLEESELRRGLSELRPGSDFYPLYQAALCRSRADWIFGMNLSRFYSCRYSKPLSVGRVQTPTLAILVKREQEINLFCPQPYWQLVADCGSFRAYNTVNTMEKAGESVNRCNHKNAYISKLTRETQNSSPPKLHTITTLQREANRLLGYTAQQTLDYAQALYEKEIISYPRTESQYLASNMLDSLPERLSKILALPFIGAAVKNVSQNVNFLNIINDSKITDHHAIISTANPFAKYDIDSLPDPEKNIFILVTYRFLAAISHPREYQKTTLILDVDGDPFKVIANTTTSAGFTSITDEMRNLLKKHLNEDEQEELYNSIISSEFKEGDTIENIDVFSVQKETTKPPRFTDDTLLSAMANIEKVIVNDNLKAAIRGLGLGTGATRAGIIENLIKKGYVSRSKKNLIPSPDGITLIEVVNDSAKSPEMTAEWEEKLEKIASGKMEGDKFMNEIISFISNFITDSKSLGCADDTTHFKKTRPIIGKCPRCGKNVVEYPKSFSCESGKNGCGFSMWKEDKFFVSKKKTLDAKTASALLSVGKVRIKGLYSEKKDTTYAAAISIEDTGKYINYKMEFLPKEKNT